MSMIGNLRVIDDATIEALLSSPEEIHDFVHPDDEEEGDDHMDIDKAWHTIHYVLSGEAWAGDFPVGFLVSCGMPIGDKDVGYGPARAFRSHEVMAIDSAISKIDDAEFRNRFSVDRLKEADIYPSFGSATDDEEIPYFMDHFHMLKSFIQKAVMRKKGLIVYLD